MNGIRTHVRGLGPDTPTTIPDTDRWLGVQ
jgi:hypothetical protein